MTRSGNSRARARQAAACATDPQMSIEIICGALTTREWCPVARGVFGNDRILCERHGCPCDPDSLRRLWRSPGAHRRRDGPAVRLADGLGRRGRERLRLERGGRLAIEAVFARNDPLIQGFILFFATVVALAALIADAACAFLDPRIRCS